MTAPALDRAISDVLRDAKAAVANARAECGYHRRPMPERCKPFVLCKRPCPGCPVEVIYPLDESVDRLIAAGRAVEE